MTGAARVPSQAGAHEGRKALTGQLAPRSAVRADRQPFRAVLYAIVLCALSIQLGACGGHGGTPTGRPAAGPAHWRLLFGSTPREPAGMYTTLPWYTMNTDGSDRRPTKISTLPGGVHANAQGSAVSVLQQDGELSVYTFPGGGKVRIAMGSREAGIPVWFRDGRRLLLLAYQKDSGFSPATVCVADAATGRVRDLATLKEEARWIALSPDDQTIAIAAGPQLLSATLTPRGLGPVRVLVTKVPGDRINSVAWSGDGRYLAYTVVKERPAPDSTPTLQHDERSTSLWLFDMQTSTPQLLVESTIGALELRWHPKLDELAYTINHTTGPGEGVPARVYLIELQGAKWVTRTLAKSPGTASIGGWSGDGSAFAYILGSSIYVARGDGSAPRSVTPANARDWRPEWVRY